MKPPLRFAPILLAVVLCACGSALAQSTKFPPYKGFVNDFANVIDPETESRMQNLLYGFEKRTGAQIAVVTIQSTEGRPIEAYANELFRTWGIGGSSGDKKDKGLLILTAINDHRYWIEVGYGLEGDLPDGLVGEAGRRITPFFKEQQYSQGISVVVQTILATLAEKWNITLDGIDRQFSYKSTSVSSHVSPIFLLILLIICFLILSRVLGRGGRGGGGHWRGGPLIFNSGGGGFGGGDGGSTSGGWGSSDSGGWGGFGGGSSGGGGAGGSW
jgi:uncharacterized protein